MLKEIAVVSLSVAMRVRVKYVYLSLYISTHVYACVYIIGSVQ